jgi:hypothetical protein
VQFLLRELKTTNTRDACLPAASRTDWAWPLNRPWRIRKEKSPNNAKSAIAERERVWKIKGGTRPAALGCGWLPVGGTCSLGTRCAAFVCYDPATWGGDRQQQQYISRRGGGKGDLPQSLALTCAAWCYTNTHTLLIHAAAQLRQCRRCAHTFDTCINSGAAHWFPLILPVVGSVFVRSLVDSRNATRRHSSAGRHTSFTFVYVLAECLSIVDSIIHLLELFRFAI